MIEPLGQGLTLTVIGASLVFLLLAILGVLIALLLRLDHLPARPEPRERNSIPALDASGVLNSSASPAPATIPASGDLTTEMLAAVMVAVRMHRRIRRKQAAPAMRTHQPGSLPSRWISTGRGSQNQNWQPRRR